MTPKDYLRQAFYMNREIDLLKMEVEQLKQLSTTVSSTQYGERISSPNRNTEAPFVRTLMKISSLEEKIKVKESEQLSKKMEIAETIDNQVGDIEERTLLYARYVNDKSWDEIYDELHRSKSATHRLHALALRNFKVPNDKLGHVGT